MADYSNVSFKNNGKLKLLIIVGTRPEIIRLAAVINKTRKYFDVILAHTGQNYDYNLNGVFFHDLQLADPEVYMNAVGADLGETMGNIIAESYKLMAEIQPDAILVLGDTNSCLSVIGAKRLHIPIFHMEAGNRCKDECLPEETNRRIVDIISDVNMAYSEHARRYLADTGLPKERTFVTGSPMAEVLHQNLEKIEASDIHRRLSLEKGKYILLSAHREENIDTEKNFTSLFTAINKMAEKYDMPILYSCHPRSRKRLEQSGFELDKRVIQHEPLGFHDYNCLQMNAFCVVSDSGTLPEESSFFTSVGHPFPAVCIRTSTERPEALDKACFVLAGIDDRSLLQAVDTAVQMNLDEDYGIPVPDYVSEALSGDAELMAQVEKLPYEIVTDSVFRQMSDTQTPQGIMTVLKKPSYIMEDILGGENPLVMILEDLQDPGNAGTILRTGEGAGVSGVLLTKTCVDITNPKVIRSTMGSVYRMPFLYVESVVSLAQELKDRNIRTFAAHLHGKNSYDQESYTGGTAFLIGNEGKGLTDEAADSADCLIRIPMCGKVESLNAAMASGILMYEAARQRR